MAVTTPTQMPVAGLQDHQRVGWLPTESGLDWLTDLAERHNAAADDLARAIDQVATVKDEIAAAQAQHRRDVRAALSYGETAPEPTSNRAVGEGREALAREDVADALRIVDLLAVAALGELRSRRGELEGQPLESFSESTLAAVGRGGAATKAVHLERLKRQVERLQHLGGIVDVSGRGDLDRADPDTIPEDENALV